MFDLEFITFRQKISVRNFELVLVVNLEIPSCQMESREVFVQKQAILLELEQAAEDERRFVIFPYQS